MIELVFFILVCAGLWKIFQKMGYDGWMGLVPFYNMYIIFKELYGNGWRMFLLLIPLYNIYLMFRYNIDLAKRFNIHWAFGLGLVFFPEIFIPILGFADFRYGRRIPEIKYSANADYTYKEAETTANNSSSENTKKKLHELDDLLKEGFITREEYNIRKEKILK